MEKRLEKRLFIIWQTAIAVGCISAVLFVLFFIHHFTPLNLTLNIPPAIGWSLFLIMTLSFIVATVYQKKLGTNKTWEEINNG